MKDPLELTINPYDLLGISVNANTDQIKSAYKALFPKARGENGKQIQKAFNILSEPQERAFVDLFLYYELFLNQLIPRINGAEAQLENKRTEIAQAWSNIQKRSYPNFAATHSLALLWYMWALYNEEENLKGKKLPSAPSLTQLWSNAISHWVFLMYSAKFMNEWIESKKSEWTESEKIVSKDPKNIVIDIDAKKLVESLENEFNKKFDHFIEEYQKNKDTESVKRIQEYQTIFQSEKSAAKKLLKVYDEGLQFTKNGSPITVCCGPIMLEQLGILESIRIQLESFIKIDPQNTNLKEMRDKLSPFANIYTHLDNKKYDEVLKDIKALTPNDQKSKEILSIQAKACLDRGKQETQNRNYKKSSEYLKQGLDAGELKSELIEAIVANCMAEVKSLSAEETSSRDLDAIIRVIKDTLKIISDSRLRDLLSEKYTDRGVSRINKAYEKWESSKKTSREKDNAESEIEKGIEDFENALKINPSNKRAQESLENAKRLLEMIEAAEAVILNAKGLELADEATELTKKGNFTEALKKINEAERVLSEAHNKAPSNKIIESNLAHIKAERKEIEVLKLNARGLELINEIEYYCKNGNYTEATKIQKDAIDVLTKALKMDPTNSTIKANLDYVKNMLNLLEAGFLNQKGLKLINEIEYHCKNGNYTEATKIQKDAIDILTKALKIDPTNSTIKANLDYVKNILNLLMASSFNEKGVKLATKAGAFGDSGSYSLYKEALGYLEQAVALDPTNSVYKNNLSQVKSALSSPRFSVDVAMESHNNFMANLSIIVTTLIWLIPILYLIYSLILFVWGKLS